MKDLFRKVQRLEIKIRKMVDSTFAGEYQSAFKGQGLEFDEVRPYQYGDDVRAIDWNVTAKTGVPYIKKFREEREQTVFVLFDTSGSGDFGPAEENKRFIGMEMAAIMAFSAMKNNDKFGLATFSDRVEQFYKPDKDRKHILKIIRGVLSFKNKSEGTSIKTALDLAHHVLKRRSVIIIISDFLDHDYEKSLIKLAHKHEVILIRLFHPNEIFHEGAGIVPVIDIESKRQHWLNAGDMGYRQQLNENFEQIERHLTELCKRNGLGYLSVNTKKDYIPVMERYFRERNQKKRKKGQLIQVS